MRKIDFDTCMAMFFTTFPNIEYKEKTLVIYQKVLKDLTKEQLQTAIIKICNNVREIYPNTNFVALIREQLRTNTKDDSLIAWITAKKAVSDIGIYQSITFEDKVINSVIECFGGWERFVLQFREEESKWIQQRFERLYDAMAYRDGHPKYLAGKSEIDNTASGYTAKDSKALAMAMTPVLIKPEHKDIKLLTNPVSRETKEE